MFSMSFNLQYFPYCYLRERGKKEKNKQTNKQQNRVRTNEAASPGVRFWKKRIKLKSRLNSQRGAAK